MSSSSFNQPRTLQSWLKLDQELEHLHSHLHILCQSICPSRIEQHLTSLDKVLRLTTPSSSSSSIESGSKFISRLINCLAFFGILFISFSLSALLLCPTFYDLFISADIVGLLNHVCLSLSSSSFPLFTLLFSPSSSTDCYLPVPPDLRNAFLQPFDCGLCSNLSLVDKITNDISPEKFQQKYLDQWRPVVVRNEMKNWSAMNHFNLDYFGQLYSSTSARNYHRHHCQFFRYRTKFRSLGEALQLLLLHPSSSSSSSNSTAQPNEDKSDKICVVDKKHGLPIKQHFRSQDQESVNQTIVHLVGDLQAPAKQKEEEKENQCLQKHSPWYIGWSNCDSMIANQLRQHYRRPSFLPKESASMRTDWLFMGTPGYGAHMHIDNVRYPSWQAQVRGRKLWILRSAFECRFDCQELRVVVEPGEIIVLDTNRWYHETRILGNELSITIGAEFD